MPKRQKVFIDGLGLVEGHFSGIGQYILGILRGMDELIEEAKLAGRTPPEVTVVIPRGTTTRFLSFEFKNIQYKALPLPFRYVAALWHRRKMFPLDVWCGKGAYIFPRFVDMPLLFSKSAGLTIYDLSYELHRQYSDEKNAAFLSKGVRESVARSKNIVTISQNAKKEIVKFYGVAPENVLVATPAVDTAHFYRRSQSEIDKVKAKYDISGNYILALSNLEPRKNLEALVDAYCALPKSVTKDVGLLLVGVTGWKSEKLFQKIVGKVEEGYNIMRPSKYVTDKDKPAIISGAKLLAYPSHYEGFGIPPLEALACGVPVVTSDNSSLPEVVKGTGKMVPSTDTEALERAILETIQDTELSKRVLIAGPKQAEKFSWKTSAQVYFDAAEVRS